jgi:hypothetical protein
MALPRSLQLYAVLVAAQWAYAALPGPPEARSAGEFAFWAVADAVLLVLLARGSFAAWGVLVVFNGLGALLLAAAAAGPSVAVVALFALTLARLAALVAGTRAHVRRAPAPV